MRRLRSRRGPWRRPRGADALSERLHVETVLEQGEFLLFVAQNRKEWLVCLKNQSRSRVSVSFLPNQGHLDNLFERNIRMFFFV